MMSASNEYYLETMVHDQVIYVIYDYHVLPIDIWPVIWKQFG